MTRTRHRLRVIEAGYLLTLYPLVVRILPLKYLLALAGIQVVSGISDPSPTQATDGIAVGKAVAAAAKRLPWQPLCLPQATAAGLMLRLRGHRPLMCFGVRRTEEGLSAHAWLILNGPLGGMVCGGDTIESFTPFRALPEVQPK
ncbi:lasso peptide biosynthesis B2 protein [Lacibacterium aquatile]|uniref:Lasso peptide biosynthesis B2 protein n=1 Tax=Lacibacterium aquatile TaxID=1168082 RepID=A0ABW5DUF3_9PROT